MKMKSVISNLNLLLIINSCLAQKKKQNITESINNPSKIKRDLGIENVEECKYINKLINKEESYNCCTYDGIFCQNNLITKM